MLPKVESEVLHCHHCDASCQDQSDIRIEDKVFCCTGCKLVYEIIAKNGLDSYYKLNQSPGQTQKLQFPSSFDYLDDEQIIESLLLFRNEGLARIRFTIPAIHCSSCLWLLENLYHFHSGIRSVQVQFARKEANIVFDEHQLSLKELVQLLHKIGYQPALNLASIEKKSDKRINKRLLYQLGLAGFCFGNIMLLSFPDYVGNDFNVAYRFIIYLNVLLALPVLVYSAQDYLISAYHAIYHRTVNIDVPIAVGMLALFVKSIIDILSGSGTGYMDSFSGFVFFLLIGKWFQSFTYRSLDFNRSYSSFFPLSTEKWMDHSYVTTSIKNLRKGDLIRVKNHQIIPVDAILQEGDSMIDYSFVTGEADLHMKRSGDQILAGGKHQGRTITLKVLSEVDNSYLTQLWNEDVFKKETSHYQSSLLESISPYFIYSILGIAGISLFYWLLKDSSEAWNIFAAVLIIACPCVLALSIPFSYGNIIRLLSKKGIYFQNTQTIESIQSIDCIVFDKTGTISSNQQVSCRYQGDPLTSKEIIWIKSACEQSDHPLSQALSRHLDSIETVAVQEHASFTGEGHISKIQGHTIQIGSPSFLFQTDQVNNSQVCIAIDGKYRGAYSIRQAIRPGLKSCIDRLNQSYELYLLSGDHSRDEQAMLELFQEEDRLHFNHAPKDKLAFIKQLQSDGKRVMMIGDGLNDAGALQQSDVGVVLSEDHLNFTPASNAILQAHLLKDFWIILRRLRQATFIIYGALILSILYNAVGLYFAVLGQLSPVVAAILMPISSISIIIYGVLSSYFLFYRLLKNIDNEAITGS